MLNYDEDGNFVFENYIIKKDIFENRFGNNYNYDILTNHENATEGWKELFNKLKQAGILN